MQYAENSANARVFYIFVSLPRRKYEWNNFSMRVNLRKSESIPISLIERPPFWQIHDIYVEKIGEIVEVSRTTLDDTVLKGARHNVSRTIYRLHKLGETCRRKEVTLAVQVEFRTS